MKPFSTSTRYRTHSHCLGSPHASCACAVRPSARTFHRAGQRNQTRLALLKRVLIGAEEMLPTEARTSEAKVQIASGILTATGDGERDPSRLQSAGLRRVDCHPVAFSTTWLDSDRLTGYAMPRVARAHSSSLITAGAFGFLILTQSVDRPDR
jgi:hypothetical protein